MKLSSQSGRLIPEKSLILNEDGLVAFRISEFGGHPVPEGGLILEIPRGGLFTVWPDGEYTLQEPAQAGESIVGTYFSYVLETADGSTLVGSFSLSEETSVSEAMQDFQAWSLPELMDVDGAVEALLYGTGVDAQDFFTHDVPDSNNAQTLTGPDLGIDDLTRLILDSQNS